MKNIIIKQFNYVERVSENVKIIIIKVLRIRAKDIINFNGDIVYRVYSSRPYEIMREEVIYLCINGGKSYGIEY